MRRGEGGEYQENSYETKKATRGGRWWRGITRKQQESDEGETVEGNSKKLKQNKRRGKNLSLEYSTAQLEPKVQQRANSASDVPVHGSFNLTFFQ